MSGNPSDAAKNISALVPVQEKNLLLDKRRFRAQKMFDSSEKRAFRKLPNFLRDIFLHFLVFLRKNRHYILLQN